MKCEVFIAAMQNIDKHGNGSRQHVPSASSIVKHSVIGCGCEAFIYWWNYFSCKAVVCTHKVAMK